MGRVRGREGYNNNSRGTNQRVAPAKAARGGGNCMENTGESKRGGNMEGLVEIIFLYYNKKYLL